MAEWGLPGGMAILLLTALAILWRVLGKQRMVFTIAGLFCILGSLGLYGYWGGFHALNAWHKHMAHTEALARLAQQYRNPGQLIDALKKQVSMHPERARGWYLLAKLYAAEGQWPLAHDAITRALALKPQRTAYKIQEIYMRWVQADQRVSDALRADIDAILVRMPNQPDMLMILASDAYQRKAYQQAADYWQILLHTVPENSEAAEKLQEAIAKAQAHIKNHQGEQHD